MKKILKHPIIAGLIVVAIASLIATIIPDERKSIFELIEMLFLWFKASIVIPMWLLILLIIFAIILSLFSIIFFFSSSPSDPKSNKLNTMEEKILLILAKHEGSGCKLSDIISELTVEMAWPPNKTKTKYSIDQLYYTDYINYDNFHRIYSLEHEGRDYLVNHNLI